jgi:pimeloyl-ACP methyl ester carboxylesterase
VRDWIVERMLYYPLPGITLDPEKMGIDTGQVFIGTEDGVRLHAFHLRAEAATRALLFLHGNAGNASGRLPNAELLRRLGTDVLVLDYRGYGLSEGRPSEGGLYADARAGLAHLTAALGFPEQRVVVFGRSLGGAVAVDLAQDRKLAGLILESTFSSLSDAGAVHFTRLAAPIVWGRFPSEQKIRRVRSPLLFFHGDSDRTVPLHLGEKLFAAATAPKAFETLRGARHNDTVQIGGLPYFERIGRFLDEVAP